MINYNNKQVMMQQAEFVLQNFFIVRPNKQSTYKLKIVVNHQSSQQKYRDASSKYKFKFLINDNVLQKPYGYICLLEKSISNDNRYANYLQIGKGQLDFNDIITNSENNVSMLNGIIYGTRAQNFDKLIAKYGYQIIKTNYQPSKMQAKKDSTIGNKITFKNHRATEKLPSIKLNQSILDQSNQINAKIRKLTSSIIEQNEDQTIQSSSLLIDPKKTITGSQFEDSQTIDKLQPDSYYSRMNDKILSLIAEKPQGLRWIQIKNIQINKYQAINKNSSHARDFILLKVIKNSITKLFQVIIKIQFNTNNKLINLLFPIPADLQAVSFQIGFMQSKTQLLQGSSSVNYTISKTVELYSSASNEQTGFISIQILKSIQQEFNLEQYNKQSQIFQLLSQKFTNILISHQTQNKLAVPSIPSLSNYSRKNTLNQQNQKQRFYSQPVRKRSRQKLTNTPFRIRKNSNPNNSNPNDSIFATPKMGRMKTQISPSNSLYLKIKNIYLNLYDDLSSQLFLKFIVRDNAQVRQVNSGFNNLDLNNKNIVLDDLYPNQAIKIHCYSASSSQKAELLGKCSIGVRDIIRSTTKQMKIFINSNSSIIGFIILELTLYRIKNNKIRAYNKPQSDNKFTMNQDEYELELSQNQVRHTRNLSSKLRSQSELESSFVVQQQNFR